MSDLCTTREAVHNFYCNVSEGCCVFRRRVNTRLTYLPRHLRELAPSQGLSRHYPFLCEISYKNELRV
jgi:hypothetical protein